MKYKNSVFPLSKREYLPDKNTQSKHWIFTILTEYTDLAKSKSCKTLLSPALNYSSICGRKVPYNIELNLFEQQSFV